MLDLIGKVVGGRREWQGHSSASSRAWARGAGGRVLRQLAPSRSAAPRAGGAGRGAGEGESCQGRNRCRNHVRAGGDAY